MRSMREKPAGRGSCGSFAGHGSGSAAARSNCAELSGVCHSDHRVLLPSYGDTGHRICGTGKRKIAGGRFCRGAGCLEKRKNVVLDFLRIGPCAVPVLHIGDRAWSNAPDRKTLTVFPIPKRWMLTAMFAACTAAVIVLRVFDPATSGLFPPCPLRYVTGCY